MGNVVCEKSADMFGEGGVFEEVSLERYGRDKEGSKLEEVGGRCEEQE